MLAEAYLLLERREEALEQARTAYARALRQKQRGNQAWALRVLGETAAHASPPEIEQAESYYHQALDLATELGMRPLVAHCHLGLGTLYLRVSRHEQAQAELNTAAEMYRAMGMSFWLEKAEAALSQVPG
jgi:tetratricopeptide (TPR) repeat protein